MPDDPATQQFVELATIAGGFIHEIKNHLNTLFLNIQLLAEDVEDPQTPKERRAAERVARLTDDCRELVDLSNDFLRFAHITELERKPVSLNDIVSRMVDFLSPTARLQNVEIQWLPAPELPLVSLDADHFEKALFNLMLNAEDAMPNGGTMTLQTHAAGEWVILDVIDTGSGIPSEQVQKIFKPFFTTKEQGTGLGLATTKKIVLAHGGSLQVQSEVNCGTKFTITLPRIVG